MANSQSNSPTLNVKTRSDIDYRYRDVFQAFVGQAEVVLDFGNMSRAEPNQILMSDRIVLSLHSAVQLTKYLSEQLNQAQGRIKSQRAGKKRQAEAAT